MRKPQGLLVSLGLWAVMVLMVGEARAGYISITLTIHDDTSNTTLLTTTKLSNGPFNNVPSGPAQFQSFQVKDTITNASDGVLLTGLTVNTNYTGGTTGKMTVSGTATVAGASDHQYTVTIFSTQYGFTNPSGATGAINSSQSNTVSNTMSPAMTTQSFTSWFGSSQGDISGPSATATPIATGLTGLDASTSTGSGLGITAAIPVYVTPYAISNQLQFTIVGNGNSSTNASDLFTGASLVTAIVPEPASLVMLLTGMTMPLVGVRVLRRRRAMVAA